MKTKFEDPVEVYSTTFAHVYTMSGFGISAQILGKKKGFEPERKHSCMEFGYWCSQQIKEQGFKKTFPKYIMNKISVRRIIYKLLPSSI